MINDPQTPMIRRRSSFGGKVNPVLMRSRTLAEKMVGIARRKENSTACDLLRPIRSPPTIVAADLDVPGIIESD